MKVAVLMGGTSAERDVSFSSGSAVAKAIAENGHTVLPIDCAYGDKLVDLNETTGVAVNPSEIEDQKAELDRNIFQTIEFLLTEKVDVVYNALHGGYGENGQLQTLLDLAGIPYTGSGSLASALGMDKHLSKVMFRSNDVPTADWMLLHTPQDKTHSEIQTLGLPLVIKPNVQGSSVGLSIIHDWTDLDAAIKTAFDFSPSVLLEAYVPGREFTVTILGDEVLPIVEIDVKDGWYDYENKYQGKQTDYFCPAELTDVIANGMKAAAQRAFIALDCNGYARIDFRLNENNEFYCLEANTLPGMTPTSLAPKAANAIGIDFNGLMEKMIQLAIK